MNVKIQGVLLRTSGSRASKSRTRERREQGNAVKWQGTVWLQEPYVRKIPVMETKQLGMTKKMNKLYTNGSGKNFQPMSGAPLRATAVVKCDITKYFSRFLKHFLLFEGPEAFSAVSWLFDPASISWDWSSQIELSAATTLTWALMVSTFTSSAGVVFCCK